MSKVVVVTKGTLVVYHGGKRGKIAQLLIGAICALLAWLEKLMGKAETESVFLNLLLQSKEPDGATPQAPVQAEAATADPVPADPLLSGGWKQPELTTARTALPKAEKTAEPELKPLPSGCVKTQPLAVKKSAAKKLNAKTAKSAKTATKPKSATAAGGLHDID